MYLVKGHSSFTHTHTYTQVVFPKTPVAKMTEVKRKTDKPCGKFKQLFCFCCSFSCLEESAFYFSSFLCLNFTLLPADGATDKTAAVLALDAAVHADIVVPDEAPDGVHPALVAGQLVIELAGDAVDLVQAGPGDGGKVVVLVVQADVVGDPVERAVVGKGLGDGDPVGRVTLGRGDGLVDVVLGDEVAGDGVQAAGEEGGEDQVEEGVPRGVADEEHVEADLDGDVEGVDAREGDAVDGHGAYGVEEDLKGAEEGLAHDGVEEEGLEGRGQIGVETVHAEGLVMGQVVRLDYLLAILVVIWEHRRASWHRTRKEAL